MISLCHPSARPNAWKAAADDWAQKCDNPSQVEYILAVEPEMFWNTTWPRFPFDCSTLTANRNGPSVTNGFNRAARVSTGNPLIFMADDLFACPHWDTILMEVVKDHLDEEAVVWAHDGHFWGRDTQNEMVHPILTRKYYERYGYVFNSCYTAWYSDTEFEAVARLDGIPILDARNRLRFDHRHFSEGKRPHDDLDTRNDLKGEQDRLTFEARKAQGFPRKRLA